MATTVTRKFAPADRYLYDFRVCSADKGWAQLDTRQDASYYGNWVNPLTREMFAYCEGDTTHTKCDDDAEFTAALRECVDWHREAGYFIGIDGMCSPPIIEAFTKLGLADLLH